MFKLGREEKQEPVENFHRLDMLEPSKTHCPLPTAN
jgi:hypothetical protein